MEFRHLICFKRVAELEHMTRAADELYMSQSHLSHVISELEDELGVKLFDREGRGIRLNPCGREFYNDVSELFTQYDDACRRVRASYLRQTTQLTLVTNVSTYMPGLIKATQKAMPAVGVQQYSAPRRRVVRMLLAGEADYAICCPIITDEPDLESTLLRVEHGVIIYPGSGNAKDGNGDHFLLTPPLIITKTQVDELMDKMVAGFREFEASLK